VNRARGLTWEGLSRGRAVAPLGPRPATCQACLACGKPQYEIASHYLKIKALCAKLRAV